MIDAISIMLGIFYIILVLTSFVALMVTSFLKNLERDRQVREAKKKKELGR